MHPKLSIWIAALALVVSCGALGFTAWNETKKETTTLRQSLTDILEQIMDIDREAAEFGAILSLTEEQKDAASFSFTNRKFLLLRQAEELYKKLGEKTTPEDDAVISVAYAAIGELEKAESHMNLYLEKAKTRIGRASGFRSLANFAVVRSDHSQATKLYDKALQEIGMPKNDMEILSKMTINWFKMHHLITLNDYESAAILLQELGVDVQHFPCSPPRGQWLTRIYGIAQAITPHLEDNIPMLPIGDGKAKCIYDQLVFSLGRSG
ncbi:MAG: hypothetical protein OXF47_05575 [Nitrospira sp.]|nr:hypothetical protein [Nitrospira sp.]